MTQKFTLAARSALMASISNVDTSLLVDITKADLFPVADTGTDPVPTIGKDWFKIILEDSSHNIEVVYVRTRTLGSATMGNLLRGQEGTTARAYASGSIVGLRHTAVDLEDAIDLAAQATTPGKDLLWAASVDAQVKKLGQSLQKQLVTAFTTAGTSTAYTITPDPAISAYAANLSFFVKFHAACGAAPTLSISGLAAPPNLVKKLADGTFANLAANDVIINAVSRVTLLSPTQAWVEDPSVTTATTATYGSGIVATTAMTFQQTTAPTGWTKVTTHNDKALRVVSGAVVNGGSVSFTTAFASQGVNGTVGNTTLSTAQIPSHTHGSLFTTGAGGGSFNIVVQPTNGPIALDASYPTAAEGGGGSHTHSFTGTAINLAVAYVDLIIATKD